MFLLGRIADVVALFGAFLGLWRWRSLDASRRLLVAFLGASAFCGLGQAILHSLGFGTAWFGNLWDLSILVLLIPACMMVMRSKLREPFKPLQLLAVGLWIVVNIALGGIPHFDDLLSMAFYGLLALVGAALFSQFIDDPLKPFRKPEFILGLVALAAGSVDAITSLAMSHYEALHPALVVGIMTARNAVWCGAYALLAYSLTLKRRTDGELREGVSIPRASRVERDTDLFKRSRRSGGLNPVWDYPGHPQSISSWEPWIPYPSPGFDHGPSQANLPR